MFVLRMCTAFFAGILSVLVFSSLAVAQEPDWTRPYIGAQLGYTTNELEAAGEFAALLESMNDLDGVIGGIQGGKNFIQQDGFIIGIIGDFNWTNADDDESSSNTSVATQTVTETVPMMMDDKCYDDHYDYEYEKGCQKKCYEECPGETTITTTTTTTTTTRLSASADIDWKSSIRTKAGFLLQPDLLVYTTGGIAFAKVSIRASKTETVVSSDTDVPTVVTSASSSDDKILTGFVIGGGFETMVTPNISAFFQALYYRFEDQNFQLLGSTIDVELEETTVMAGLSFYFN